MKDTFLSPVPAIIQRQRKTWDQMLTQLGKLSMDEDETALQMGDLLVEIEEGFGKSQAYEAAEQVQIGRQVVKQRIRVSRKIPKGHPLREADLKFSHLRVLAALDEGAMVKWAAEVTRNQWSVAQLMKQLEASGDQQAQEEGAPCIQCEKALPPNGEIVSFTIGHQKRARCCGVDCAAEYFQELREEAAESTEPAAGDAPMAEVNPWPLQSVAENTASAAKLSDLWQQAAEEPSLGDCLDLANLPPLADNIFN